MPHKFVAFCVLAECESCEGKGTIAVAWRASGVIMPQVCEACRGQGYRPVPVTAAELMAFLQGGKEPEGWTRR